MTGSRIGLDLNDPLAPWWVAQFCRMDEAGRASWVASRGKPSEGLRLSLARLVPGPEAQALLASRVGVDADPQGLAWLGGEAGPRLATKGLVLGQPGAKDPGSCAPAHAQALVRTAGLWATRFELRWLMIEVAAPQLDGSAFVLDARELTRALEGTWPQLAGKCGVHVETHAHPHAQLRIQASFAGAPGRERLQASLRDAAASPSWRRHLALSGPDAMPGHVLDRAQVWVDPAKVRGLGPLASLRAWYDARALMAERLFAYVKQAKPTSAQEAPA